MTYNEWLRINEQRLRALWLAERPREAPTRKEPPKYYQIASTHIVEIDPLDLKLVVGGHFSHNNYVNASFVWWEDYPRNQKPYPTSMLVYDGEIIKNGQPNNLKNDPKGAPTPTFIVYKNGTVTMKDTNDLSGEASRIHLAVTVAQTNPNLRSQGFAPYVPWSSIAYQTHRIGIFYRKSDNKVLLVYRPSTTAGRFRSTGLNLKADFGGTLDSGGSAHFKVNGRLIQVSGRRMYAGITWEG